MEFFYDQVSSLVQEKIYTFNTDHDNYIIVLLKIKEQTVEIDNIT